jgi:tetratricopeptide (TPR) repeat protein
MVDQREKLEKAVALVDEGLRAQQAGEMDTAIRLYRDSIDICPTAEAHTYLGWALSNQGKLDEAITNCHQAIAIDPDFGNPYNDIGVYLMQRNQPDGAIPWLEKAKLAARYEPRHYPYINLGHIYAARGELIKAIDEFKGALKLAPWDDRIRSQLAELSAKLN